METHSLKTGKTRAWANYDIMRHAIDTSLLDPDGLRRAVREADREMLSRAGNRSAPPVYLAGKVSDKSRPLVYHALKIEQYKSEITGASVNRYIAEKDDLETSIHDQIDTTVEAQMPLGYLVPAAWKQVADLLALHGVEMERTAKPLEQEFVEIYRFTNTKFASSAVEGHVAVEFEPHLVKERIFIPAGSYWIPLSQRQRGAWFLSVAKLGRPRTRWPAWAL